MTRLEALRALRTRLAEQGRAIGELISRRPDGTCRYCAVGHLLKIAGLSDQDIEELQNQFGSDAYDFYSAYSKNPDLAYDYVETLEAMGFTRDDLEELQGINDTKTLEALIVHVDGMIKAEEAKIASKQATVVPA